MSDYDDRISSSDLDAFKHAGEIQTVSMTISGTVAGGAEKEVVSSGITLDGLDFNEIVFDNSSKHSGKFHNINERITFVLDTTSSVDFSFDLESRISTAGVLSFRAHMLNTTASTLSLQTTTLNFRYVPYEATI